MNELNSIEMPPPEKKHSKLGIASFIIAIVMGIIAFVSVIAAVFASHSDIDDNELSLALVGLIIIGTAMAQIVGVILGIIGLTQKNTKKVFSILGLIFNLMAVFSIGFLMILGLAVSTPS